jgi:hypothetical protein
MRNRRIRYWKMSLPTFLSEERLGTESKAIRFYKKIDLGSLNFGDTYTQSWYNSYDLLLNACDSLLE